MGASASSAAGSWRTRCGPPTRPPGLRADDVALTTSTTDGVAIALGGLELGPGDEVVTSDDEHPGLNGPLQAARDLRGADVRAVPLADVADAVGPRTRRSPART